MSPTVGPNNDLPIRHWTRFIITTDVPESRVGKQLDWFDLALCLNCTRERQQFPKLL